MSKKRGVKGDRVEFTLKTPDMNWTLTGMLFAIGFVGFGMYSFFASFSSHPKFLLILQFVTYIYAGMVFLAISDTNVRRK